MYLKGLHISKNMAKRENEELITEDAEPKEAHVEEVKRQETERLIKRDIERQKELERKKQQKKLTTVNDEEIDFFIETFNVKKEEIELALSATLEDNSEISELPAHFNKIKKCIQSLQNFLSLSSYFLREYDLRTSRIAIQELHTKAQALEEIVLPKKKFCFKLRKTVSANNKSVGSVDSNNAKDSCRAFISDKTMCDFTRKVGENISLCHDSICKKDVILSHLDKCTVYIPGVPSTLHISALQNCHIFCGPIMTSAFIEDCIHCTFVLAGHQIRIHSTKHCDFYIHVTSKAIIEDTSEVRFAPYNWKYNGIEEHFQLAELNRNVNNWEFVSDFNWLAADKMSPHWCVINEENRINEWLSIYI